MKKFAWIILLIALIAGCQQNRKRELKAEDRVEVPAIVQDKANEIENNYRDGKISLGEYRLQIAELQDEAARLQLRDKTLENADYLPQWALDIGLKIPEHMKILPQFSHMTSKEDDSNMFNSITLVYEGNYDTAMIEAEKIAQSAGIPLSTTWEKNLEMSKKLGNPPPKGITYMNYDFGMNQDKDYLVTVEVDETGRLTISAADARQMKSVIDRHTTTPQN